MQKVKTTRTIIQFFYQKLILLSSIDFWFLATHLNAIFFSNWFKILFSVNMTPANPLSPVCWRMWLTRCSFLVNDLEQKPHRCGDSPVCCRTWFNRCSFRVNVFEQKSQRWGVSPVCHMMWFVKCSFLVNDLPEEKFTIDRNNIFFKQQNCKKKKTHRKFHSEKACRWCANACDWQDAPCECIFCRKLDSDAVSRQCATSHGS